MDQEVLQIHEKQNTQIAVIMTELGHIRELIVDIKERLKDGKQQYAPLDRFERVEKIVYGGAGLILAPVLASLLALVLR